MGCKNNNFDWTGSVDRPAGFCQTLRVAGQSYDWSWIPQGEYDMGSPEDEEGRGDDETLHHVKITRGFWMLQTPTTQGLFEDVTDSNPSKYAGRDRPVEMTRYADAIDFCKKLTALLPLGMRVDLPTECEWERAIRANTTTPYYWGDEWEDGMANAGSDGPEETTPVKSYPANPWGLYDMCGNVWEWTKDWYGPYQTCIDPCSDDGDDSARTLRFRVIRGGGWGSADADCRSAKRHYFLPVMPFFNLGFRPVLRCE